jgi:hypothetical protein
MTAHDCFSYDVALKIASSTSSFSTDASKLFVVPTYESFDCTQSSYDDVLLSSSFWPVDASE